MNGGIVQTFQDEDMSSKSDVTVEMDGNNDGGSAFATLLTDDSFFPGVTALCKSLRATNTGITQQIVVTTDISPTAIPNTPSNLHLPHLNASFSHMCSRRSSSIRFDENSYPVYR